MGMCHGMKMGEVYTCRVCHLELMVVHECDSSGTSDCEHKECTFVCCDQPVELKETATSQ
jgi:hypothetical protein